MKVSESNISVNKRLRRVARWSAVVLYTVCLPEVIFVYRWIVNQFSPRIAAYASVFIITAMAAIYTLICMIKKMTAGCLIVLAVSGIIVMLIMNFEANANKHIHIPEYILMSWILYRAIAYDYSGSGIVLLVFISAAMLGVVDEIMQGIHPQRTYGGTDMIVDTAAALIGCLSLKALKQPPTGEWAWCKDLRHLKGSVAVMSFGAIITVLMCSALFKVKENGIFFNRYSPWLLAGNGLFVAAGMALAVFHWRPRTNFTLPGPSTKPAAGGIHPTAVLWIFCPMVILMVMHTLVLWVAAAGINFK